MGWPTRLLVPLGATVAGALSLGLLSGCYPWDTGVISGDVQGPSVLMPEPNGAFVHRMQDVQTGKAQASQYVFFLDEWYLGGTVLGPYGTYHLQHIIPKLPNVPYPVVIQPGPEAALNESRRQVIVAALVRAGIAEAEQRVIIAFPDAEGLYGEESPRIYYDMLRPKTGLYGANGLNGAYGGFGAYGGYGGFNSITRPGYLGYGPGINPFGY
jgi:hypothetical protein